MKSSALFLTASLVAVKASTEELGNAANLFSGPIEVAAADSRFQWLESPIYSPSGKCILFSDVKWKNDDGVSCGMLWKYDVMTKEVSELLKCSGTTGPPNNGADEMYPDDIDLRTEAGSNGLYWGWNGDGDLLMNQHGWSRIVRLNIDDIDQTTSSIDSSKVTIVASEYNSTRLNSPNDLVLTESGELCFTDPPFGLQYNNVDDPFGNSFELMTQDAPAAYCMKEGGDPSRVISFEVPEDWSKRSGPNGIAHISGSNLFAIVITDFNDPRVDIYEQNSNGTISPEPNATVHQEYRIEGTNSGVPALSDGITYDAELEVLILSGPGGIYLYETASGAFDLLGFIRIDDLCSNNVIGGGYLWMTCNQRLLRIPLAGYEQVDVGKDAGGKDELSNNPAGNASFSAFIHCPLVIISLLLTFRVAPW
jgi:gluconolactonase